jgi:UDP-2,3-diacylglucosamine pyrophosphatase LpxH
MDSLIISDLHLGSSVCQAKQLSNFLSEIHHGNLPTQQLIINGDVFDSWDFRRLNKHHWNVLSEIRKLSDHVHVTWINGNHDGPAEVISHLIGVDVAEEYRFTSGDQEILCLHGHIFDTLIDRHPRLTHLADMGYRMLMKLDKSFSLARSIKRASKTFMRNSERIETQSRAYAAKLGCDIVCTGHTHFAVSKPHLGYFNSGCWTETPCTYLAVENGHVELRTFDE